MSDLTVEKVWEGKQTAHFRVSRGSKGGEQVTVRVGIDGVYLCLTCISIECIHATATEQYDKGVQAHAAA